MEQPVLDGVQIPDQFRDMSEEQFAQVVTQLRNPMYNMMLKGLAAKLGMQEFLSILTDNTIPPEKAARFISILRDCAIEGVNKEEMFRRFRSDPLIGTVQVLPF